MAERVYITSSSSEPSLPCSRELNGVAQLVAWLTISKRFFHPEKHRKWHNVLYDVCESLSSGMTVDTARLLTMVSLVIMAHSDKDPVDMRRIVGLLGKVVLFPELQTCRDEVEGLLEEAKCQAVLQCCGGSENEEALAVLADYFGPASSDTPSESNYSELGCILHNMLRRKKGKASTADLERFFAEHCISRFMKSLQEFLSTAPSKLNSFCLYSSFQEQLVSQVRGDSEVFVIATGTQLEQGEAREVREEEEEERGEEEEGEKEDVGNKASEPNGGGSVPAEVEVGEGEGESETEGMEHDGQDKENQIDSSDESEVIQTQRRRPRKVPEDGSDEVIPIQRKKLRKVPEGEELDWDSCESSEVSTPPSHLPERRSITVRGRDSLVGTKVGKSVPQVLISPRAKVWSHAETENLLKGVKKFGIGKWHKIMQHFEFASYRNACSLKDKWRNLQGRKYH